MYWKVSPPVTVYHSKVYVSAHAGASAVPWNVAVAPGNTSPGVTPVSCSTAESKPTNRSLSLKPATGVAAIAASVQGKLKLLPWTTWVAADACEAPPTKAAADNANATVCVHETEVISDPRELIHDGSR